MFVYIVMYQTRGKFVPWDTAFVSYTRANRLLAELRDKDIKCYTYCLKVEGTDE